MPLRLINCGSTVFQVHPAVRPRPSTTARAKEGFSALISSVLSLLPVVAESPARFILELSIAV